MAPPLYTKYTPLRCALSSDILVMSPDYHYHTSQISENIPPTAAPNSDVGPGEGSKKRKHDKAHHTINDRRSRQKKPQTSARLDVASPRPAASSYRLPQGTQHDPFEIESSPEPEANAKSKQQPANFAQPSRQQRSLAVLTEENIYIEEPSSSSGKIKYYAVAGGHVPGIYTDWDSVQTQIKGFSGAKQRRFGTISGALVYLNAHKDVYYNSLNRRNGHSKGPAGTNAIYLTPERTWPPDFTGMPDLSPSIDNLPDPQFSSLASDSSPIQETYDLPPPYTRHAQSAQYALPGTAPQPIIQDNVAANPEPILDPEQQEVVDLILEGHNVFYTGSAGCGKSTILKAFVKQLKAQGKMVRICAPTNLAALNVNGQTTWNFAGWTPNSLKKSIRALESAAHGTEVWQRFDTTDVLVIDEISMVENLLFERLNAIMKASRGQKYGGGPFGGVQLIVTGDFCQLSPVKPFQYCMCGWEFKRDHPTMPKEYECENRECRETTFYDIDKWAFRSRAWEECDFKHINLTKIHRQSDKKFISILQKIRTAGVILLPHANLLLNHTSETEGGIKLFARRDDVDRINNENIAQLPSEPLSYKCVDHFNWKDHHRNDTSLEKNTRRGDHGILYALKDHRYEVFVQLKEGMRVVLQANLDSSAGLVNGSQGTIIGFEAYDINKMPRKLENKRDVGNPDGPTVRGAHAGYFENQIKIYAKENGLQPWPVVRFDNGSQRTIYADCTANELGDEEPYSLLSRTQIPLMAGYAITIHKSQGMTLDRVIVNLSRAFEPSQIYVALSRARSLKGLKVEGLPRSDLGGANAQVKEFFERHFSNQ